MEGGSNWWYKPASGDEAATSFPWPAVEAAGTGGDAAPAASGSRRYYECDICKGGFTTAQALGGHMNIHRRGGRGSSRRSGRDHRDAHAGVDVAASASRANAERYGQYGGDMASYPPAPPTVGGSFAAYYPWAATSTTGDAAGTGRELSLFGADTRHRKDDLGLGLGHHGRGGDGGWSADGHERQAGEPEGMVDLELRLGRRSGWY
ncbi:hypothetical protein ACP4OV_004717 [Aristida adscensionis]